ncbi:hypothetical protein A2368_01495 [Candidatus Collierbacteria bacterium RIFOXYB1_FULL_49_13]|uniref:Uncharacterized protein n=1 Tax=Candidatus Collierbacteria bacterium RIFOXYB1_FULL_49_13 TaxID=1817728 RepID=A0A1F5FGW9_9BACT|nr:MAG: hypothetical protein A2368_01495 [Candidatus Collierbacteria bacterium RIFOXYB1_FULL_49_13]
MRKNTLIILLALFALVFTSGLATAGSIDQAPATKIVLADQVATCTAPVLVLTCDSSARIVVYGLETKGWASTANCEILFQWGNNADSRFDYATHGTRYATEDSWAFHKIVVGVNPSDTTVNPFVYIDDRVEFPIGLYRGNTDNKVRVWMRAEDGAFVDPTGATACEISCRIYYKIEK